MRARLHRLIPRRVESAREDLWMARMRRHVGAERFAAFGADSVIEPPAVVLSPHRVHIGEGVVVHGRCWFSVVEEVAGRRYEPRLSIGDGARIGHDAVISCVGEIEIGERVLTADRIFITDTYHDFRDVTRPIIDQPMADPEPVRIGAGAFLGVNSVVLGGVTVGEGAFIGAGAVVTEDVGAHCVAVGNPARVVRHWDAESEEWRPGAPG